MLKQVIIIRSDLKMSKGKLCAQSCHASLSSAERASESTLRDWKTRGQKKIIAKVNNQKKLGELKQKAEKLNLANFLVADAGLTELEPGTVTALGVGPGEEEKIDKVTGKLPLL